MYDEEYIEEFEDNDGDDLVRCPSCGEMVFDDTQKCPYCGDWIVPLEAHGRQPVWIRVVAVVVAATLLLTIGAGIIRFLR